MGSLARATWRLLDARQALGGIRIRLATCVGVRGVHLKRADLVEGKDNPYLEKYRARIEEVQG